MVVDAVSPLVIGGPVDTSPAFTVAVENRPVLPEDPPLTERCSLERSRPWAEIVDCGLSSVFVTSSIRVAAGREPALECCANVG